MIDLHFSYDYDTFGAKPKREIEKALKIKEEYFLELKATEHELKK